MQTHSPHRRPTLNRQGALPLHLTLAMLPWIASSTALRLSQSGLGGLSAPQSEEPVTPRAAKLKEAWQALLQNPALARVAEEEARKRAAEFLTGLRRYQEASFVRDVDEPPVVLSRGNAKLLDYGADKADAPAVFLIPSLINRYYILDLTQKLSFARFLRARGFRVFIVDWGKPSETERHYNCAFYITETLVPMSEWIREHSTGSSVLAGYCMGGLLSLALAQIRPDLMDACAFFATPWDFFAGDFPRFAMDKKEMDAFGKYIDGCDAFPAEMIHTLFHCANPYAFQNKLRQFSRMSPGSEATHEFLAIEHWVNDGVPMTRGVARDCLIDWTQRNAPALGAWHVGGQVVDPRKLRMPCFVAAPQDDRIVPSGCALPLVKLLKNRTVTESHSGHVGMMVGSRRKSALWEPFVKWAQAVAAF